jgi:hypothetical protein
MAELYLQFIEDSATIRGCSLKKEIERELFGFLFGETDKCTLVSI